MNATHPDTTLNNGQRIFSHADLDCKVRTFAQLLRSRGTRVIATLMDNGPAWVVADLAAAQAGVVHVPLPLFFTPPQIDHALQAAGVDTLLTSPRMAAHWPGTPLQICDLAGELVGLLRPPTNPVAMPPGTSKITFTSGTTGAPKGVCLDVDALHAIAHGLLWALEPLDIRRHLCALPLAVLLENVAGLMAPLARGAECVVLPLQDVGLTGSSSFDPSRLHAAVVRHQPHSLILLPQMLRAWIAWLTHRGERAPASLRMVAVGGASVGAPLVLAARAIGIPAYEGYGLSEGASVQTLNLPGADRPGSAGKPLPHARVRVSDSGEIEVAGSLFVGYLGETTPPPTWWPTGDLGHIDTEGFVHVMGRRKHVLITGFGRNISPEWVETALRSEAAIAQAVVFGDAQPALSAVLWPTREQLPDAALAAAVNKANATLPDYAQVRQWVRGAAAFSVESGLATANGRPQREAIYNLHAHALTAPAFEPQ
ncbi:AMP-binding protein [Hydrogenophaga sp.]|uniref:AMP-binding protein n=1 Tax=Hydrogenophaga sp. TaxID=1904254 RepID=UPI002724EAC4|nr:AMP-binding protein [Hydrogenophaga sp.]MDO9436768.1 AMP-binding protein [Hydrogenophaga sp.]